MAMVIRNSRRKLFIGFYGSSLIIAHLPTLR
jgi:hypothetical protein